MWDGDDGHMDDGWSAAMVVGMAGLWILIAAVVVVALVWAVRSGATRAGGPPAPPLAPSAPPPGPRGPTGSAQQILAERLARGEIDTREYRERFAALHELPGP